MNPTEMAIRITQAMQMRVPIPKPPEALEGYLMREASRRRRLGIGRGRGDRAGGGGRGGGAEGERGGDGEGSSNSRLAHKTAPNTCSDGAAIA